MKIDEARFQSFLKTLDPPLELSERHKKILHSLCEDPPPVLQYRQSGWTQMMMLSNTLRPFLEYMEKKALENERP